MPALDVPAGSPGPNSFVANHPICQVFTRASILEAVSGFVAEPLRGPRLGRGPLLELTNLRRHVGGVP